MAEQDDQDLTVVDGTTLGSAAGQSKRKGTPVSVIHEAVAQLDKLRSDLEARKAALRSQMSTNRNSSIAGGVVGLISIAVVGLVIWLTYALHAIPVFVGYIVAVPFGLMALIGLIGGLRSNRWLDLELFDVQQDLDLLSYYNANQEQRAEKLFRLHQAELKKYYDITRSQSVQIFYVGIAAMILGVFVICVALALAAQLQNAQLGDRIVVAALGVAGSVMTNFIAVIFLRMYSATASSLAAFHSRLVSTHHLHYASFLAAKIGEQELREKTLAEMATAVAASKEA